MCRCGINSTVSICNRCYPGALESSESATLPGYVVRVAKMVESHRETYWVILDRGDRPKDAKPWDEGRITPFKHENKSYVDEEAAKWARFLGVKVTT